MVMHDRIFFFFFEKTKNCPFLFFHKKLEVQKMKNKLPHKTLLLGNFPLKIPIFWLFPISMGYMQCTTKHLILNITHLRMLKLF